MVAYNIHWDTDGELVELPDRVPVPRGVGEEDVADWLSDEYGWCVFSLNISYD